MGPSPPLSGGVNGGVDAPQVHIHGQEKGRAAEEGITLGGSLPAAGAYLDFKAMRVSPLPVAGRAMTRSCSAPASSQVSRCAGQAQAAVCFAVADQPASIRFPAAFQFGQ